jgi:hypothetical protein
MIHDLSIKMELDLVQHNLTLSWGFDSNGLSWVCCKNRTLVRKHGSRPVSWSKIGLGPWSNMRFSLTIPVLFLIYNFFEPLTMVIRTRKVRYWTLVLRPKNQGIGHWSFGPEKPGLDLGHSDQKTRFGPWLSGLDLERWFKPDFSWFFGPWSLRPRKTAFGNFSPFFQGG